MFPSVIFHPFAISMDPAKDERIANVFVDFDNPVQTFLNSDCLHEYFAMKTNLYGSSQYI